HEDVGVLALEIGGYRVNDSAPLSGTVTLSLEEAPHEYALDQNYPNPFNATTRIRYGLPERSHVKLTLYNSLGAQVAVLVDALQEADYYSINYDASRLASGIYFYRLDAGGFHKIRKMVLLK
ncbi:T9SS type A sorting domain-containing protein, partial [bacterium]|nr:T9SS type A sorting domain-containing protein [bacterium]